MRDADRATDLLTRLRIKGIGLSIDDFGTGYSSLSQLQRLPFSEVKIDKSFVIDCTSSKDNAAIVYAVIDLSHRLGLKVVAEGVETADALRLLAKAGCDAAQGYFISKPIGGDKIPAWLEANPEIRGVGLFVPALGEVVRVESLFPRRRPNCRCRRPS